ncbi:hypothetical protein BJP34_18225 [Moorena producens PAL-8-15-08-1]|uniref:Uncharacterized protein n=1 Tax=Moorena producens PAL-8-15-08-1 TaxID=1458985 RepID=A0A1D8TTZ9_9CYAN|nr:hypothetical protein BJP34_18225 [Moorena producens PAL-8-15-08-1]
MEPLWLVGYAEKGENLLIKAPLSYGKFKPLALCIKTIMINNDKLSTFSYPPHPTPHTLHPTPDVFVKNIPLKVGGIPSWGLAGGLAIA